MTDIEIFSHVYLFSVSLFIEIPIHGLFVLVWFFLLIFLVGLFVTLLQSFNNSLYILDNNPISDTWYTNTFSWLIACLSIFVTVSFAE